MENKTLYIVSTPIGNLKDMSARAIETLENCDLILCEDTRISLKLLNHFNIKKPLQKYEKFSEEKVSSSLEALFEKYNNIALITDAGTPCISDPGSVLVKKARALNANVFAIPGSCAIIYAISVSGFKYDGFSFLGFLPRTDEKQKDLFLEIEKNNFFDCFCFYESPNRLLKSLRNLAKISTDEVCVINDATKLHEKHYCGKIEDVILQLENNENLTKGEYVVVFKTVKNTKEEEKKELSKEALLVEEMITKNCSIKEAVKNLSESFSRNELYKASLNVKNLFNDWWIKIITFIKSQTNTNRIGNVW